jgi:tRNA (mo5U34)-methyltransferase
MPASLSRLEIERRVRDLGPWFHNLDLHGVKTAPEHFLGDYPTMKWRGFSDALPSDLSGKTVLDIGCNAGFFSLEMKRRGAQRVVAIDTNPAYLKQAAFAAELLDLPLELRQLPVYRVAELAERFDLVFFTGVFYHLRHPLLALDLIRAHVAKDTLVFQSMLRGSAEVARVEPDYAFSERAIFDQPGYPRMHFVEQRYSADPTNWWIPNRACVEALLRSSGFHVRAHPEEEVYVCDVARMPELQREELSLLSGGAP